MTFKKIAILSVSVLALLTCAVSVIESPSTHVVYAAKSKLKTRIAVPKGYTANLVEDWHDSPNSKKLNRKLKRLSRRGMLSNKFYDRRKADKRKVNLANLSNRDQYELSQYALTLINSIRTQLGLPRFVYTASAQNFANDIAKAYNEDNWGDYQGHDISAINQVAKQHGLTQNDNEYEDMCGFDITTGYQYRSEEHTSELQSRFDLVCRLLLEKKKKILLKSYISLHAHCLYLFNDYYTTTENYTISLHDALPILQKHTMKTIGVTIKAMIFQLLIK